MPEVTDLDAGRELALSSSSAAVAPSPGQRAGAAGGGDVTTVRTGLAQPGDAHSPRHLASASPGAVTPAQRRSGSHARWSAVRARAEPSAARRLLAHPLLMPYHRLTALVLAVNGLVAWHAGRTGGLTSDHVADLVLWNFVIAFGVRRQSIVNVLFEVVGRVPHRWPLRLRSALAKVHHHGGVHVGTTVSGTVWTGALAVLLTREQAGPALLATTWTLVAALGAIVLCACPPVRHRRHDLFEASHRYGGWATMVVLWIQTILAGRSLWPLVVLLVLLVLPWLRLRRVPVSVERPSDHVAIVRLADGTRPAPGAYTAVGRRPFGQWHSFALVPRPGDGEFRILVSRAGDWTGEFIDSPPSHLWIKGIPTAGVASVATMFRSVLWVATGSGIAPVLPHLLARPESSHLLWIGRTPQQTYGTALVDEVKGSVATATIWNTERNGKPDTLDLTLRVQERVGAEAVIVISNKPLTWQLVRGLTARGVPVFGAIWDS